MPATDPKRITETERAVATMARRAMSLYRASKAIGAWHPSATDTRRYPWPDQYDHVPGGVAALGPPERADDLLEVELGAEYVGEGSDPHSRFSSDEITIKLHGRGGVATVLQVWLSPQGTLSWAPLPPDIPELLPVLRWVLKQATEGSW